MVSFQPIKPGISSGFISTVAELVLRVNGSTAVLVLLLFALAGPVLANQDFEAKELTWRDTLHMQLDTAKSAEALFMINTQLAEEYIMEDASLCLSHINVAAGIEQYYVGWLRPHLLNLRGMCYDDLGMYDDAIDAYERAIRFAEEIIRTGTSEHPLLDAVVPEGWRTEWDVVVYYNNLGYTHYAVGNYLQALKQYLEAERYAIESDCPDLVTLYGSLAELFYVAGDFQQARSYVDKAFRLTGDVARATDVAGIAGSIYLDEMKMDSAKLLYDALLHSDASDDNNYSKAIAYEGLARVALQSGEYEHALGMIDSSLVAARLLGSTRQIASALELKGSALVELGEGEAAHSLIEEAILIMEESNTVVGLERYYKALAGVQASMGDYEGAFESQQRAVGLHEDMHGDDQVRQLARYAMREELEKQNEITAALQEQIIVEKNKEKRQNTFSIAMMLLALLSAVAAFIMRRKSVSSLDDVPAVTYKPEDDKLQFLEKIMLTIALLFIPMIIYAVVWAERFDIVILMGCFGLSLTVFLASRLTRNYAVPVLLLMLGYPIIAAVPLHTGPVPTFVLWIAALFLILAYTLRSLHWQIVNGVLAILTYFAFSYFGSQSGIVIPVEPDPLDIMVGVVALGALLMALYYHKGELVEYRFGLDRTSSFLKMIADLNPNFIFAKNLRGQYLFANSAMTQSYGVPLQEFIGKTEDDIQAHINGNGYQAEEDQAVLQEGQTLRVPEQRVFDVNGEAKWLETVKKPLQNDKGKIVGLVGIATDITEKRNAIKEQERFLSLLTATLESTADALLVVDNSYNAVLFNTKFESLMESTGGTLPVDGQVRLNEFAQFTRDPEAFLERVHELMDSNDAEATDIIELKDGRILERYSQAQLINGEKAGRVWSFRNVTERVRTDRALKASEQLYRTILDDNHFPIFRMVEGRVNRANKAFADLAGLEEANIQGLGIHEFIHAEDLALFLDAQAEVLRTKDKARSLTCRVVTRDGQTRFILASMKGFFSIDDKPLELVVTAADITQMKQFEKALKESEERYRSLLEASPDGIIMTDVNGYVNFASNQMIEMLGLQDFDRFVGRHMLEFSIPEERERAERDLKQAMNSVEPIFGRFTVQLDNGKKMVVELGARRIDNSTGQPIGLMLVTRDVTRHIKASRELRESELKYRTLFESTFDGFLIIDQKENLVDGNPSALELLACRDIDGLSSVRLSDIFDKDEYRDLIRPILNGSSDRSRTKRMTGHNLRREPIYVELSFSAMLVEEKTMIACAIRDVAEKVVLEVRENELRQQEIEVEALNRELTASALYASQKNKLLSDIREDIESVSSISDDPIKTILQKVKRKINSNLSDQDDLLAFRLQFEKVHPNFFNRLLAECPKLTDHELKYCAYIRLNMTTQDICNLLYVEKKSVEMSKYRIKKKLKLNRSQRLSEYLHSL